MTQLQNFPTGALPADADGVVNDYDAALRRIDAAGRVRACLPKDGVHSGANRLSGLHAQGGMPVSLHLRDGAV